MTRPPPEDPIEEGFWGWWGRVGGARGIGLAVQEARAFLLRGYQRPGVRAKPGRPRTYPTLRDLESKYEEVAKRIGRRPLTIEEFAAAAGVGERTVGDAMRRFGVSWPPPWPDHDQE